MNTVMDVMYFMAEMVAHVFLRLVEIAVVAFLFWGFWVAMVWAVNRLVGGG